MVFVHREDYKGKRGINCKQMGTMYFEDHDKVMERENNGLGDEERASPHHDY